MTAPSWCENDPADTEVDWQIDLFARQSVHDELAQLRTCGNPFDETSDRKLLMLTAMLRIPIETSPRRVVEPDALELKLLQTVRAYRQEGTSWPVEAQRLALVADRRLRDLGVVRQRYRDACAVLGLTMAEAVAEGPGEHRRWWWPPEVPSRPIWTRGPDDRPVGERPIVYLPSYDGEPDVLGLGEGWQPGELLIVSAGHVVDAWNRRAPARPQPETPPPAPIEAAGVDEPELQAYVDEGLRGLADFLRWDGQS